MPINDHYVIIGNGPAGNHAAGILRDKDSEANITIISDEAIPFYYKPRLTRYLLDEITADDLLVKKLTDYKDKNIRLRLGQTVERIDIKEKRVYLGHMESVRYTKLIIAAGSRARVLPAMEPYARFLTHVSSYNETMLLKDEIKNAESVFIFGGDLVGFKFVRMLAKMKKKVSLLICPQAFWPFNLTEEMEKKIEASLSGTHVDLLVRDDIASIQKEGLRFVVDTRQGKKITADLVFSFTGLVPCVDFALGSGLTIDRGILVNERLQTSDPDIYACGSCAQIYNSAISAYATSIGWPNAVVQGETAALNLLGDNKVIESAGRKYFDLEGVKIKTTWWEDIESK